MSSMDSSSDHNDDLQSKSELDFQESDIKDRIHQNSQQQKEVVNIIAKISLLTIVSEIFINGFLSLRIHLSFHYHEDINSVVFILTVNIIVIIGLCLNCFTLYATFEFNHNHYIKCCGLCHRGLKNCCVVCVARQSFRNRIS